MTADKGQEFPHVKQIRQVQSPLAVLYNSLLLDFPVHFSMSIVSPIFVERQFSSQRLFIR